MPNRTSFVRSLYDSEPFFRSLFENSSDAVFILSANSSELGRILCANQYAATLHGYSPDELLNKNIRSLKVGVDAERTEERLLAVLRDGFLNWRSSHSKKNGQTLLFEASARAIEFQDERFILAVERDITEQSDAEDKLKASEEKYRLLFENMTTAFALHEIVLDTDGHPCDYRFLEINPMFERLTGLLAKDILGKNLLEVLPSSEKYWVDTFGKVALTGTPIAFQNYAQALGRHYDLWAFSPRRMQFAVVFSDCTERVLAEQQLRQTVAQINAINSAKSEFIANMSHEVRTPLNAIIGMTELALELGQNEVQKNYLNVVCSSARSLLRIVNDILDFSKLEARKYSIDSEAFSLRESVRKIVMLLQPRAQEKDITLTHEIDTSLPDRYVGDDVRIGQILLNLMGNAIKFTPESGSVSLAVSPAAKSLSSAEGMFSLQFNVRDTGIGIAQDKIEQIFEPFTQAEGSTARKFGGTGLGLTISRELATLMGGSINAESVVGSGSQFIFRVGLLLEVGTKVDCPAEEKLPKRPKRQNANILVVDDNHVNRQLLRVILSKLEYQIVEVDDGTKALALLCVPSPTTTFAAVLLDCHMAELDGYEVARRIRQYEQPLQRHTPIIAVTATVDNENKRKCLDAGMDDFIGKPFSREQLQEILARWIA